ncbi:MAG: DNA-binding protein [Polycyclovorans sp.]|nr:DNA-binding protein [Polycyclovorans sp.]
MNRDLTVSSVDRQNILNNPYALEKIQNSLNLPALEFEGEYYLTRRQVADLYDIDDSTLDRYLAANDAELRHNGYVLMRGKQLKNMQLQFGPLINAGSKTTQLGFFTLRAVLNLGMLLVESERARALRARMLDIVLDTLAERSGGHTKYINQRSADYLINAYQESQHRKEFTSALSQCVDMGNYKYALFTDRIYQSIFKENAREYRKVLQLEDREKPRDTMYAEVLLLIASFETGLAHELTRKSQAVGRKLTQAETEQMFADFESMPLWAPQLQSARTKMASRDLHFREALHQRLEEYIKAVPREDFEQFLGKTSKSLEERLKETEEVFKRLKDR